MNESASRITIGQVRAEPLKGDVAANGRTLLDLLAALEPDACDVIVTPECFLDGYMANQAHVTPADLARCAVDPAADGLVRRVAAEARRLHAWIVLGCTRRDRDDLFNSTLLLGRDGTVVGSYDKTHCQTHDRKFTPGRRLPLFQSEFGPFGILICADRRWPEAVRALAVRGARILFNPTCGMAGDLNLAMMRTRAYESEIFIAFTHPRQSLITAPDGRVICDQRDAGPLVTVTTVDLAEVDRARTAPSAHLRDRRIDLY